MDPHCLLTDWLRTTFPAGPPSPANRTVPSFLLPDHEGWLVSSEEMKAQGPYVLTFFHGGWCERCVGRLKRLEAGLDRIHEVGADVVVCSPETLEYPRRLKADAGLRFHVLSDVDSALSIDLGLAFPVSDETRAGLKALGVDLEARHGDRRLLLPVPITMIVDRRGAISKTFADHYRQLDVDEVVAALCGCNPRS